MSRNTLSHLQSFRSNGNNSAYTASGTDEEAIEYAPATNAPWRKPSANRNTHTGRQDIADRVCSFVKVPDAEAQDCE